MSLWFTVAVQRVWAIKGQSLPIWVTNINGATVEKNRWEPVFHPLRVLWKYTFAMSRLLDLTCLFWYTMYTTINLPKYLSNNPLPISQKKRQRSQSTRAERENEWKAGRQRESERKSGGQTNTVLSLRHKATGTQRSTYLLTNGGSLPHTEC